MFGLILKEVGKTVILGVAGEVLKEKVLPPVTKKVKEKIQEYKDKKEENAPVSSSQEFEAKWE